MESQRGTWPLWSEALTSWSVWRRSLTIGLLIGCIQIAVNQGDVWLSLQISSTLIWKTLATPLIATSVALFSSSGAYVEISRKATSPGVLQLDGALPPSDETAANFATRPS